MFRWLQFHFNEKNMQNKSQTTIVHLNTLLNEYILTSTFNSGRLFRADYLSKRGKWLHLSKLLTVVFIPIFGGWAFTLYSLADNVIEKDSIVGVS